MIVIAIPGDPKGKQRPRLGKGYTYTPKQTVNYENWVKMCYLEQAQNLMLQGEIKAEIIAYYSIPKSTSKKKRQAMMNEEIRSTKKPDLDNIAKIILDSLNTIAYKDDSQIIELQVKKYYSDYPRIELQLQDLKE